MPRRNISIHRARTHNLKNASVEIPHGQLTVITGPSGSGKSSLAFDTLYAEGQRRFVESMSTYVRQFLERMERPDVDDIDGILPALSVEQKNSVKNARSTVATATELADYIRLFMTYTGETWCRKCSILVKKETPQTVTDRLIDQLTGKRVVVVAPVFIEESTRAELFSELIKAGFYRVWVDEKIADLKELDLEKFTALQIVTGRAAVSTENRQTLIEAVEQAFTLSRGSINVFQQEGSEWISHRFSSRFSCDHCGAEFQEPVPHLFSFNSPLGACTKCQGYGRVIGVDMDKVIPARSQTLDDRPVAPWNSPGYEDTYDDLWKAAKKYKLRTDVPVQDLSEAEQEILYNGKGTWYGIKGFFDWLETKKYKVHVRVKLAKYRKYTSCGDCSGSRLKPEAMNVRFREKTIADLFQMNVRDARRFWEYLALSKQEEAKAGHLRREVVNRLVYLDDVGLSYLTLDRQTRTLSGGESQRINLAAALGSGLTQTLYVVDEPTVGLHARDSERLLAILRKLRNGGNTVVVVEHDPTMIAGGDHIIEMGPGAGEFGGQVLYDGPAISWPKRESVPYSPEVELPKGPLQTIRIVGAREHNLKNVDAEIPLGRLVAITGVSGSGKSTLMRDCLYNGYQRQFRAVSNVDVGAFDRIDGIEHVDDVQFVDQSPIGRSTRSNPATYTKAWDEIRKLLADTTSAKVNGVTAGMFSFNTTGGRCDTCEGSGKVTIDMQFLADIEVICEKCDGKRFNPVVLKVMYNGMNVDRILDLTVDEAIKFFVDRRPIVRKLTPLRNVGLGYLRLGQSTATLSGGEAQRLKLAAFLINGEKQMSRRLFLFDEPTTGLHARDVTQLLKTFRELIALGNSVVVIEHNMQLIEHADHIIDLGPEGGDGGGEIVATGTVDDIRANARSVTGKFLYAGKGATTFAS